MDASRCLVVVAFSAFACGCVSPAQAPNTRGVALFNTGQYESARAEFLDATAADPVNADAFYNLGSAYHRLDNPAEAERNYMHCLALNPNHTKAQHAHVVLMLEEGRVNDAYSQVNRWMSQNPGHPDPMIELAWLDRQAGKTDQAREQLHQVIAINPRHSRALTELAAMYETSNDSERALALYQRALAANPNHPDLSTKVADLRAVTPGVDRATAQNPYTPPDSTRTGRDMRYQLR
jgi:tetratricopeptide (TPR) repeat protein